MPGPNVPYTKLDFSQVIKRVFDETNDRLRVDSSVSVVMGTVEVIIDHTDDSIRLGDGVSLITSTAIFGNQGLDVFIINDVANPVSVSVLPSGTVINTFNSISSVASASEVTIVSYTVPVGKQFYLQHIQGSGENIATYKIYINSTEQARKRTFWGSDETFNVEFEFSDDAARGIPVAASLVIEFKVIHNSTTTGDFDGRIIGVLSDA